MTNLAIFTAALDLEQPWQVEEVYFEVDGKDKILRLKIGYNKGSKFEYEAEKTENEHIENYDKEHGRKPRANLK